MGSLIDFKSNGGTASGYLALPEAFKPIHLVVTLEAKGSSKAVQRSYEWNALLTESGD